MSEPVAAPDVQSFKREFLLDPEVTFLNHGSFGACPEPVMQAFWSWQRELEREPVEFMLRRASGLVRSSMEALAAYRRLRPRRHRAGAERDLRDEHGRAVASAGRGRSRGHHRPRVRRGRPFWEFVCEQTGATLVRCELPVPAHGADEIVSAVAGVLDDAVRVVSLSHITSPTGLVLPVRDVCRLARDAGAITVIDGAHGPGQLDLDLDSLGADFYVGNCHKWLCSPKVAGFLYTRPEVELRVDPLVVSWGWDAGGLAERAHWQGTQNLSALLSIPDSIRYQEERDWPAVRARCAADAAYLHERLLALPGVTPVSQGAVPMFLQMVSVLLPPGTDPQVQEKLFAGHSIELPVNEWHGGRLLRASVAAYNDRADLDRLVGALGPLLEA